MSTPTIAQNNPEPQNPQLANSNLANSNADDRLVQGQSQARELAVGQEHLYRVALAAGDYLAVRVAQQDITLMVKVLNLQGNTLLETNNVSELSFNTRAHFIAPQEGVYQLVVVGLDKTGLKGRYQLTVNELRPATATDQAIVAAEKLVFQARNALGQRQAAEALKLLEAALLQQQQAWPLGHPAVADTLQLLGQTLQGAQNLARREQLLQRSLELREKFLGAEHPDVANSLEALGELYYQNANYRQLEIVVRRTLAIRETAFGQNHISVAQTLSNLAFLQQDSGDYESAEVLFKRSLASYEQILGPKNQAVTTVIDNLASLYQVLGDYQRAEELFLRSIAIQEAILGEANFDFAISLNNLGGLYGQKAEYGAAEFYFKRSLAIIEKLFGKDSREFAHAVNNLAGLYLLKGEVAQSAKSFQQSLAIFEKAFGPQHPTVAVVLSNLAGVYKIRGNYQLAEEYFQRALVIREKLVADGGDQQPLALLLNNLGELQQLKGNYPEADKLFQQSLAIREKQLGGENITVANTLAIWGRLARLQGNYKLAETRLQRCRAIREKALGNAHPDVAGVLGELAVVYESNGEIAQAAQYRIQANEAREREILRNLSTGSELQKLKYLELTADETSFTVSLHLQRAPQDQALARAALTILLRRKGRALDAMTGAIGILRQRATPQDQQLFADLSRLRNQIATLANRGPGKEGVANHQARLQHLSEQADDLENQISMRSAVLGRELQLSHRPITLEAVQQAIPADAVLLEFATYRPFQATKNQYLPAHYVVYLLENQGDPKFIDLGPVTQIDAAVQKFREKLIKAPNPGLTLTTKQFPAQQGLKTAARRLDSLIMQPVRQQLGKRTRLLISPDSTLNLIPFDALVDQQQRYLVARYEISYLTSGRDLLRLPAENLALTTAPPVILANPDYGQGDGPKLLGQTLGRLKQLAGAAAEGNELQTILPQAQFVSGTAATETLIRKIERPSLLHIATHV
jgi:tetratricopeptide (TPR) repeat protein